KKTLAREPHHNEALLWCGMTYLYCGKTDVSLVWAERWVAVDPLSAFSWTSLGFSQWFIGKFDRAVEPLMRAVDIEPTGLFPRWQLGYTYALVGKIDAAAAVVSALEGVDAGSPYNLQLDALVKSLRGVPGAA